MSCAWLVIATLLATSSTDAVLLRSGERIKGKILEASPEGGVRVQLPDGTVRWFHSRTVERVEPAGGEPKTLDPSKAAPPSAPAASHPGDPVPLPSPPSEPSSAPSQAGLFGPGEIWMAAGGGIAWPSGDAAAGGQELERLTGRQQTDLLAEAGVRLNSRDSLGARFDLTFGSPGPALRAACSARPPGCETNTSQLGLFFRREFARGAVANPWLSAGVAREWLYGNAISNEPDDLGILVLEATGWLGRAGLGVDFRVGDKLGVGLYADLALGRYSTVVINHVDVTGKGSFHRWALAGVRVFLGR